MCFHTHLVLIHTHLVFIHTNLALIHADLVFIQTDLVLISTDHRVNQRTHFKRCQLVQSAQDICRRGSIVIYLGLWSWHIFRFMVLAQNIVTHGYGYRMEQVSGYDITSLLLQEAC